MIISLPDDAVGRLVDLALAEADQHRPRTRERRAAAALMVALAETKSVEAAKRALADFADPQTVADALELLHRLAVELNGHHQEPVTEGTPS